KQLPLATALAAFQAVRDFVVAADPFDLESIAGALTAIGEAHTTSGKAGPFLGRMRLAVTGQPVSPPPLLVLLVDDLVETGFDIGPVAFQSGFYDLGGHSHTIRRTRSCFYVWRFLPRLSTQNTYADPLSH
ncbi:MAG TPA: hypothetical protein VLA72_21620, partial [Anaerolineales bacterium]|nr:hypothetical protein [Anaerolineales bacterium]